MTARLLSRDVTMRFQAPNSEQAWSQPPRGLKQLAFSVFRLIMSLLFCWCGIIIRGNTRHPTQNYERRKKFLLIFIMRACVVLFLRRKPSALCFLFELRSYAPSDYKWTPDRPSLLVRSFLEFFAAYGIDNKVLLVLSWNHDFDFEISDFDIKRNNLYIFSHYTWFYFFKLKIRMNHEKFHNKHYQ